MATIHRPLLLQLHTPKASKRKTLLLILSVVFMMCSATFVAIHCIKAINPNNNHWSPHQICARAQDQASCMAMVSETTSINANTKMNGVDLLLIFLNKSTSNIQETIKVANQVKHRINSLRGQAALIDCVELLELSVDRITDSMAALEKRRTSSNEDAHAWLSGVLTNHVTCLDGLDGLGKKLMEPRLVELMARATNSLAVFVAISPYNTNSIQQYYLRKQIQFPSWVTSRDRLLLQPSQAKAAKANVVVAKDGSGNYKTVKEAVASAPDNSKTRYVIYVKKGTYKENVEVGKKKKNLMIVGDGMDLTIITGSLNVVDGSTTFNSATIAVGGDGFIAQDLWIQNTAGPEKHQAVALRVSADQSVINRCRIEAYQDTLYAHTNRQFYRDCYITGTVDFIFGNAAVVLQNCKIAARKPMSKQSNMITAQGRTDPNQNTGTSIQKCEVIGSPDLEPVKGSIRSYLGRPWKEYSRTVVMQSHIGDHIDPAGWSEWSGDFALKTLYYGEYLNGGPGAGTSKRVKWPGYHVITDPQEAKKFTVAELIGGGSWLKSTGVAYTEGL